MKSIIIIGIVTMFSSNAFAVDKDVLRGIAEIHMATTCQVHQSIVKSSKTRTEEIFAFKIIQNYCKKQNFTLDQYHRYCYIAKKKAFEFARNITVSTK